MTEITEAVEATTEDTASEEAAKAEAEAKAEASVEAFQEAARAAVAEADPTTGTIAEAHLEPVKLAYRAVEGGIKYKNQAKNFVSDEMKAVLEAGDLEKMFNAVAWNNISSAIAVAPKAQAAPKVTVSPNKLHADKVQALSLAYDLVTADLPEGVTEDFMDEVDENDNLTVAEEYLAWVRDESEDKGDEPEVSNVIRQAVKLALGKGPRKGTKAGGGSTYAGPKRSVAAHVRHAFDTVESGTFLTMTEIRNIKSPEYGDDLPSGGAINQLLRPSNGKPTSFEGVSVEQQEGKWGARKL